VTVAQPSFQAPSASVPRVARWVRS
jgi:hypothetical protein